MTHYRAMAAALTAHFGPRPLEDGAMQRRAFEAGYEAALKTYLIEAVETERHACSIAVWMTLMDALEPGADDKGVDGWMREAEQRVKNRANLSCQVAPTVKEYAP